MATQACNRLYPLCLRDVSYIIHTEEEFISDWTIQSQFSNSSNGRSINLPVHVQSARIGMMLRIIPYHTPLILQATPVRLSHSLFTLNSICLSFSLSRLYLRVLSVVLRMQCWRLNLIFVKLRFLRCCLGLRKAAFLGVVAVSLIKFFSRCVQSVCRCELVCRFCVGVSLLCQLSVLIAFCRRGILSLFCFATWLLKPSYSAAIASARHTAGSLGLISWYCWYC